MLLNHTLPCGPEGTEGTISAAFFQKFNQAGKKSGKTTQNGGRRSGRRLHLRGKRPACPLEIGSGIVDTSVQPDTTIAASRRAPQLQRSVLLPLGDSCPVSLNSLLATLGRWIPTELLILGVKHSPTCPREARLFRRIGDTGCSGNTLSILVADQQIQSVIAIEVGHANGVNLAGLRRHRFRSAHADIGLADQQLRCGKIRWTLPGLISMPDNLRTAAHQEVHSSVAIPIGQAGPNSTKCNRLTGH